MTTFQAERQIILDTETTGLDPTKGHRLTEIGCLEMINRRLTGRKFQTYLNPERAVDPDAERITGLSFEFLKDKPKFSEVVEEFLLFVNHAELIIHNAPFDMAFLNAELCRLQYPLDYLASQVRVFDTLLLAKQLHPGQRNNLDALCKRYGVVHSDRTYHGGLLDAEILAMVYLQMTAGQTQFSLGENEQAENNLKIQKSRSKLKRSKHLDLVVIEASEAEIQLHTLRMEKLKSQ